MAKPDSQQNYLPAQVKVLGTFFLLFQILFALNNYGPQRIPLLNLLFDQPWVGGELTVNQQAGGGQLTAFELQDITGESGLEVFIRAPVYDQNPSYVEVMGGGVAVGDYDGDGWEDLFFTGMQPFPMDYKEESTSYSALFRNQGDGTFARVSRMSSGLSEIQGFPQGALFFDFDNSGTPDLYVAAYGGGQLFSNHGGKFVDITDSAGLSLSGRCGVLPCFVSSAAAADYNRDGLLDLLLINNVTWDIDDPDQRGQNQLFPAFFPPQPSLLFKNNGDGTFTDVTDQSGLTNRAGKGLSAVWTDINMDGWPDVYIANDLSHNRFYINNSDGTFSELASGMHLDEIKSSMGTDAGDFDNDGDWDLVTTNLRGTKLSLFKNTGDYRFEYDTDRSGLGQSRKSTGWGIVFVDLDLDGYQDLVTSSGPVWEDPPTGTGNLYFRNLGNRRFEELSGSAAVISGSGVSRGLAVLDADRSGTPDLVFANIDGLPPQLLTHQAAGNNNWLKLDLEGVVSNRDAVGVRVHLVRADGMRQMQEVRAGGSYQSSGSKSLFFGLGKSLADSVIVHWPSGKVDTLTDLQANHTHHIRESK